MAKPAGQPRDALHRSGMATRRIGFIAGQAGFAITLERIEGYKSVVAADGLGFDSEPSDLMERWCCAIAVGGRHDRSANRA
jgi:hypothetical protein